MFRSLHIDYKNTRTELCQIGSKYDTDKSSQRLNADHQNHCHPYTCFYHSLFKNSRHLSLRICELGILYGASLKMWRDYFTDVQLHAFEYNTEYIQLFKNIEFDNVPTHILPHLRPVSLEEIDVTNHANIAKQFQCAGFTYDLIIEDTTHQMDDQINVIMEATAYLNPGGVLIVEDVFLKYDEHEYKKRLEPILDEYQDIYFVTLDHQNRISTGWENDKLLVMVKKGKPIFKNEKKLTLITPSIRPENIMKLYSSIRFEYVDTWYIIYDGKHLPQQTPLFGGQHPQIVELVYSSHGISGNPQRNHALDMIKQTHPNTYVYFLDDDNTIHPLLYSLLNVVDDNRIYTFDRVNREEGGQVFSGNNPTVNNIDASQFLVDFSLISNIRWIPVLYNADGYFIELCGYLNTDKWVYVNNVMAHYNSLGG